MISLGWFSHWKLRLNKTGQPCWEPHMYAYARMLTELKSELKSPLFSISAIASQQLLETPPCEFELQTQPQ